MPYFDVNVFGTTHAQHDLDLITFNLHVMKVDSDISPTNFDMFISFYAFPFNFKKGTRINAFYPTPSLPNPRTELIDRFNVSKPQVIHITGTTPDNPVDLYDCSNPTLYLTGTCRPGTTIPLISPCPNPEDIRLFSGTFCVPTGTSGLKAETTNMLNSATNSKSLVPNIGINFILPLDITIIADGCVYRSKKPKANIYTNYNYNYVSSEDPIHPYGNVDCSSNGRFYPIGYRDVFRVN